MKKLGFYRMSAQGMLQLLIDSRIASGTPLRLNQYKPIRLARVYKSNRGMWRWDFAELRTRNTRDT